MEARLRHNLDELLKVKGLRASDLSKITGIPKQTLSEWRAGLVPKSVIALKRVATAFGITLDELIFTSDLGDRFGEEPELKDLPLKQTFEGLAALSPAAILLSDSRGYCLYAPAAALLRLDRSPAELIGRPWIELIASDRQAEVMTFIEKERAACAPCQILKSDLSLENCQIVRLPLSGERYLLAFVAPAEEQSLAFDERSEFSLAALFRELRGNFELQAWTKGYELRMDCPQELIVNARRRGLHQVLFVALNSLASAPVAADLNIPIEVSAHVSENILVVHLAAAVILEEPPHAPQKLSDLLGLRVVLDQTPGLSGLSLHLPLREATH